MTPGRGEDGNRAKQARIRFAPWSNRLGGTVGPAAAHDGAEMVAVPAASRPPRRVAAPSLAEGPRLATYPRIGSSVTATTFTTSSSTASVDVQTPATRPSGMRLIEK